MGFPRKESFNLLQKAPSLPLILSLPLIIQPQVDICQLEDLQGYDLSREFPDLTGRKGGGNN